MWLLKRVSRWSNSNLVMAFYILAIVSYTCVILTSIMPPSLGSLICPTLHVLRKLKRQKLYVTFYKAHA